MDFKLIAAAIGILFVFIYAFGSGIWVSSSPGWYASLNRPAWQPPSAVIGLIWPYNFTMLVVATWLVASRLSTTNQMVWLISLALSVIAALSWAKLFFVPHSLLAAAFALVLATVFTIPLLVLAFRASPVLGFAFLPYQLWLAVATSLAFGFAALATHRS